MRGSIPFIGNFRCEDRGSSLLGLCARAIGAYLHTLEVSVNEGGGGKDSTPPDCMDDAAERGRQGNETQSVQR